MVEYWLSEVIENLYPMWHLFFGEKMFPGEKYIFSDQRTTLSLIMFKHYNDTGFFDNLYKWVLALNKSPHFEIETLHIPLKPEEIRFAKPYNFEKLKLAIKTGRIKILAVEPRLSVDNNANKFVAFFIDRIISHLTKLNHFVENYLRDKQESSESGSKKEGNVPVLNEILEEINNWKRKFIALRWQTFLGKIPCESYIPVLSYKLFKKPLYRQILSQYLEYSKTLVPEDIPETELSYFEDWRIYELWVLFKLKETLESIKGKSTPWIFSEDEQIIIDGTRENLKRIFERLRTFEFEDGLILAYQLKPYQQNLTYISTPVRPDFGLFYKHSNDVIILDAKHMEDYQLLEESKDPEEKGKTPFEQMHIYRDNIRNKNKNHCVKMGVLIYPYKKGISPLKRNLFFYNGWKDVYVKNGVLAIRLTDNDDLKSLKALLKKLLKLIEGR